MLNIHSRNPLHFPAIAADRKQFINNAVYILKKNGVKNEKDAKVLAKVIETYYNAHDRFYHTTVHINKMVEVARLYFKGAEDEIKLEPSELLAILFHDIVYRPGQTDNEELSIDLMVTMMASYGVHLNEFCWASRCIRETKNHLKEVEDTSTHVVLDLDLVGLAGSFASFNLAGELIFKEYPDSTPLDRAEFLKSLAKKPKIFYRLTWLEEQIRTNINIYVQEAEKQHIDKQIKDAPNK